jgi:hypothetical protein
VAAAGDELIVLATRSGLARLHEIGIPSPTMADRR